MKFVLFVAAVVVLIWLLRGTIGRRLDRDEVPPAPTEADAPRQIVACAQCGLHLPRDDALPGLGGVFCSEAHRAAFEKDRPRP